MTALAPHNIVELHQPKSFAERYSLIRHACPMPDADVSFTLAAGIPLELIWDDFLPAELDLRLISFKLDHCKVVL